MQAFPTCILFRTTTLVERRVERICTVIITVVLSSEIYMTSFQENSNQLHWSILLKTMQSPWENFKPSIFKISLITYFIFFPHNFEARTEYLIEEIGNLGCLQLKAGLFISCSTFPTQLINVGQRFSTFSDSWTTWQVLSWFADHQKFFPHFLGEHFFFFIFQGQAQKFS